MRMKNVGLSTVAICLQTDTTGLSTDQEYLVVIKQFCYLVVLNIVDPRVALTKLLKEILS